MLLSVPLAAATLQGQWKSVMFGSCAFFTRAVLVEGTDEAEEEGEGPGRRSLFPSPLQSPPPLLTVIALFLSLSFPHDVSDRRKRNHAALALLLVLSAAIQLVFPSNSAQVDSAMPNRRSLAGSFLDND